MNNSTCIILKKSGLLLPQAFVEKVLKENTSCSGVSIRREGKNIELVTANQAGEESLEAFMETQEAIKDYPGLFVFSHYSAKEFLTDDIQPFHLQVGEDTILSVAIEGVFPAQAMENGKTPESNLFEEVVLPALQDNLELAGRDFNKFMERINQERFKKMLLSYSDGRGTFAFMPIEGDPWLVSNAAIAEFPWGSTNISYGYSEKEEIFADADQAPVKKGLLSAFKDKVAGVTKSAKEVIPAEYPETTLTPQIPKTVATAPLKTEVKTDTKAVEEIRPGFHKVQIPERLNGKGRKKYIKNMTGSNELPEGWHQNPAYIWVKDEPVKDLKDIGKAVEAKAAAEPPKPSVPITKTDKGDKYLDKQDKIAMAKATVMTADTKSAVQTMLLEHMGIDSNEILDPLKMQEMESRIPDFCDQMGIKSEDLLFMSPTFVGEMCAKYPAVSLPLFLSMRRLAMSHMDMKALIDTKKPAAVAEPVAEPVKEKVAASGGLTRKKNFNF